jgi:predicted DCC family thiol-disulfide oxidoreductase YuxK
MTEKYFIIYDGSCNFCNKMIMFIANNDKHNNFIFVSNLSEFGTKLLLKHNIKGLEKATTEEYANLIASLLRKLYQKRKK